MDDKKTLFLACYALGERSPAVLHANTSVPLRTINFWLNKMNRFGTLDSLPRIGRPLALSGPERVSLAQTVRHDPATTTSDLASSFGCSPSTVSRQLSRFGLVKRVPRLVFLLTEVHRQQRLE